MKKTKLKPEGDREVEKIGDSYQKQKQTEAVKEKARGRQRISFCKEKGPQNRV